MRILVVSDSHGDKYNLIKAIDEQKSAEIIIHCGDSRGELSDLNLLYKDKMIVAVKGNCDMGSTLENTQTINVCGKKIFVTHGHLFNAKYTLLNLCLKAREEKADILLFGHTHNPLNIYDDGLYILNPGSLHGYNATYGYIDVTDKGILTNIVKLK